MFEAILLELKPLSCQLVSTGRIIHGYGINMGFPLKSDMQVCRWCNYAMAPGAQVCTHCGKGNANALPDGLTPADVSIAAAQAIVDENVFFHTHALLLRKNKPNLAYVDINAESFWNDSTLSHLENRFMEKGWNMKKIESSRYFYIRLYPIKTTT